MKDEFNIEDRMPPCIFERLINSKSFDGMTADITPIDIYALSDVGTLNTNKVPRVNNFLYEITSKPPSTIELE